MPVDKIVIADKIPVSFGTGSTKSSLIQELKITESYFTVK